MTLVEDRLIRYDTREALAAAVATRIAAALSEAIEARGCATLALSGGATPAPLYRRLGQTVLPWSRVTATLADERWIGPTSADSNERLVRDTLMAGPGASVGFLPLWRSGVSLADAAETADRSLAALPGPLDAVVLGMGEDGHTASLFPHSTALDAALDLRSARLCVAVPAGRPAPAQPRLSLTLRPITEARLVVLVIVGPAKLEAFAAACGVQDVRQAPVAAVLGSARTPVEIAWAP